MLSDEKVTKSPATKSFDRLGVFVLLISFVAAAALVFGSYALNNRHSGIELDINGKRVHAPDSDQARWNYSFTIGISAITILLMKVVQVFMAGMFATATKRLKNKNIQVAKSSAIDHIAGSTMEIGTAAAKRCWEQPLRPQPEVLQTLRKLERDLGLNMQISTELSTPIVVRKHPK